MRKYGSYFYISNAICFLRILKKKHTAAELQMNSERIPKASGFMDFLAQAIAISSAKVQFHFNRT